MRPAVFVCSPTGIPGLAVWVKLAGGAEKLDALVGRVTIFGFRALVSSWPRTLSGHRVVVLVWSRGPGSFIWRVVGGKSRGGKLRLQGRKSRGPAIVFIVRLTSVPDFSHCLTTLRHAWRRQVGSTGGAFVEKIHPVGVLRLLYVRNQAFQ